MPVQINLGTNSENVGIPSSKTDGTSAVQENCDAYDSSVLTFQHDEIDSTNDQAKRLIARYPDGPLRVIARCQSKGRGRSGRGWTSPVGGAWFSLVWPVDRPVERFSPVSVLAGWAVWLSLDQLLGDGHRLEIKWPNDVLLGGRKLAGVLCEQVWTGPAPGAGPASLVVGVGINANFQPACLGRGLRVPATSLLAATGKPVDLKHLITQCTASVIATVSGQEHENLSHAVLADLHTHLAWMNEPVSLRIGERAITGICRGLDPTGALRLTVEGRTRAYDAGEVEQLSATSIAHDC